MGRWYTVVALCNRYGAPRGSLMLMSTHPRSLSRTALGSRCIGPCTFREDMVVSAGGRGRVRMAKISRNRVGGERHATQRSPEIRLPECYLFQEPW